MLDTRDDAPADLLLFSSPEIGNFALSGPLVTRTAPDRSSVQYGQVPYYKLGNITRPGARVGLASKELQKEFSKPYSGTIGPFAFENEAISIDFFRKLLYLPK